jgi:dipeptidyl aminopeptidase/acylaminoacyl peptidase
MCLYGYSNGGGVVSNLVTRTDRFRCAVVVAPHLPDWLLPINLTPDFLGRIPAKGLGLTPEKNLDDFIAMSAVYHLAKVHTPVLLADGDKDQGFILGTIEMYNGLRRQGKEVTLIRYPDQGHGFTGAAMKDFWEREMAFFGKYLKLDRDHNSLLVDVN